MPASINCILRRAPPDDLPLVPIHITFCLTSFLYAIFVVSPPAFSPAHTSSICFLTQLHKYQRHYQPISFFGHLLVLKLAVAALLSKTLVRNAYGGNFPSSDKFNALLKPLNDATENMGCFWYITTLCCFFSRPRPDNLSFVHILQLVSLPALLCIRLILPYHPTTKRALAAILTLRYTLGTIGLAFIYTLSSLIPLLPPPTTFVFLLLLTCYLSLRYASGIYHVSFQFKKDASFHDLVEQAASRADFLRYSLTYYAPRLMQLKQKLYNMQSVYLHRGMYPLTFQRDWNTTFSALGDKASVVLSKKFFQSVSQHVDQNVLIGNAYRIVAISQFQPEVRHLIKRGLSSVLPCDDILAAHAQLLQDIKNRGTVRQVADENFVIHIAISYRYEKVDGLSDQNWLEVVQETARVALLLGYSNMRLWIDRIAVTAGLPWCTVGYFPYFVYPTYVHDSARLNLGPDRLWIALERLAASLGPGVFSRRDGLTENEVLRSLLLSRSPIESILAVCEVLVSGSLDELQVSFHQDKHFLRTWAKGVLTTTLVDQVFSMPTLNLQSRANVRHDLSMLCLYDNDLSGVAAIQKYRRSKGENFYCRERGRAWNVCEELFQDSSVRTSADLQREIERRSFVLHSKRPGCLPLCWYVLPSMRGEVVFEVGLHHTGDIRQALVRCCRLVERLELESCAEEFEKVEDIRDALLTKKHRRKGRIKITRGRLNWSWIGNEKNLEVPVEGSSSEWNYIRVRSHDGSLQRVRYCQNRYVPPEGGELRYGIPLHSEHMNSLERMAFGGQMEWLSEASPRGACITEVSESDVVQLPGISIVPEA